MEPGHLRPKDLTGVRMARDARHAVRGPAEPQLKNPSTGKGGHPRPGSQTKTSQAGGQGQPKLSPKMKARKGRERVRSKERARREKHEQRAAAAVRARKNPEELVLIHLPMRVGEVVVQVAMKVTTTQATELGVTW